MCEHEGKLLFDLLEKGFNKCHKGSTITPDKVENAVTTLTKKFPFLVRRNSEGQDVINFTLLDKKQKDMVQSDIDNTVKEYLNAHTNR